MKKTLLSFQFNIPALIGMLSINLLMYNCAKGQTADQYILSSSQSTFSNLAGGVPVSEIDTFDAVSNVIPIGFSFDFAGATYTDIKASSEGWITFNSGYSGGSQPVNATSSISAVNGPVLFPLWTDLNGVSFSGTISQARAASYLTTGTAPNRIFTFEWRNWAWNDPNGNIWAYPGTSFQVKLFESSNKIQFIYEPLTIGFVPGSNGYSYSVGIASSPGNFLCLGDLSYTPTISTLNFINLTGANTTLPNSGQTFTFVPPVPCTGAPSPGAVALPSPYNLCSTGAIMSLVDTGYAPVVSPFFQWQFSANGGSSWSNIPGATQYYYQDTMISNIQYRLEVGCSASSQVSYTPPVIFNVGAPPLYNSIPYFQDFENWMNYCGDKDVPGTGWLNSPNTGNSSWRRNDQSDIANWANPSWGNYATCVTGSHSARFHSSAANPTVPGNLDLYIDCSGQVGEKGLYFYFNDRMLNTEDFYLDRDSLAVFLSDDGGTNFSKLATFDSADWERIYLPISSNTSNTIIRFQGFNTDSYFSQSDMFIDSIFVAMPCSGIPSAGYIAPGGAIDLCPGSSVKLSSFGASISGGLLYQWEYSTDNGQSWNPQPGGNNLVLKVLSLYDTTLFRLKVICSQSGQSATTNIVTINIQPPNGLFASLPFIESFENWVNRCDTNDVPAVNNISSWTNSPAFGKGSWRRNDEISLIGQINAYGLLQYFPLSSGLYYPFSIDGNYSARFHNPGIGNLDLMLNCSSSSQKELQFFLNMHSASALTWDSLKLLISEDGGATFSRITSFPATIGWEFKKLPIVSSSANTIIRFSGVCANSGSGNSWDIGLDLIKALTFCTGQPAAGTIDSTTACAGKEFFLRLTGTSQVGDLSYKWQHSPNGISWTNLPVWDSTPIISPTILSNTWFRCIVTCNGSGLSDTSSARLISISPFYYCYCDAYPFLYPVNGGPYTGEFANIGNIHIENSNAQTVLNKGNPVPLQYNLSLLPYTDYRNEAPAHVFRDSFYNIHITEILSQGLSSPSWPQVPSGLIAGFIDFNRNGVYDLPDEQIFSGDFLNHPNQVDSDIFHVPANAQVGLTGMRFILHSYNPAFPPALQPGPCDVNSYSGEVEDYLIRIDYEPCGGPASAGLTYISDTLVVNGIPVLISNNTHDNPDSVGVSQLSWIWQSSTDSVIWSDIAGSEFQDSVNQTVTVRTWFRLKMICANSEDTTYSNVVSANVDNTSIPEISGYSFLRFYPNPTDGMVNLTYSGLASRLQIVVTDVLGNQITRKIFVTQNMESSFRFHIGSDIPGIYFIRTTIGKDVFYNRVILK